MRPLRLALTLVVLMLLAGASSAEARSARARGSRAALGLGGDYVVDPEIGAFQLTFALESYLARSLTAGVRFGALVTSDPSDVGAPIDFRLRIRTRGIYLDGLVGPWLVFDSGDTLRFHAAFGFGVLSRSMSFGLEVGVLERSGIVGLRLAFPI